MGLENVKKSVDKLPALCYCIGTETERKTGWEVAEWNVKQNLWKE